jgi:hypothetical protein
MWRYPKCHLLIAISYIKSLPQELLPTFWTGAELELLVGTTLAPAVSSKLKSLRREWELLCSSASQTRWYNAVQEYLDFDDWLHVDAMYRSRALDIPGVGHCMVPCVDLANHESGNATVALYEKDADGNAVLLLRNGKALSDGDEITITYGDEKGACEMLFSYSFLEADRESAETLFLSLQLPGNTTLQDAKIEFAGAAPGFKLIDAGDGNIEWTGDFIWMLCVNDEDGLHFEIAMTVDGNTETEAFFQDHRLTGGASGLHRLLEQSELREVYRLRAVTLLQQRIFDQLEVLYTTQDDMEALPHGDNSDIRECVYHQAMKLRSLEFDLMNRAYESFERQVSDNNIPTNVEQSSLSNHLQQTVLDLRCG